MLILVQSNKKNLYVQNKSGNIFQHSRFRSFGLYLFFHVDVVSFPVVNLILQEGHLL